MASPKTSDGSGSVYQRHKPDCPKPTNVKGVSTCKCPWVGAFVSDWRDGKPIRKRVTGQSKTAATFKLNELIDKIKAGDMPRGKVTVAEWLTYWLEKVVPVKARPSTQATYRSHVDGYIVPLLGHRRLDKLTPEHIDDAWRQLAAREPKPLSPTTIHLTHVILSRALKVAVQRSLITRNPATLMDAPQADVAEAAVLTREQAKAIIEAATGTHNAARWTVALSLGLRQGEALGLRWDDVDLEAGVVHVHKAIARVKGKGLVLGPVKSKKGERRVAVVGPLAAALKEHKAAQNAERLAAGNYWHDDGHVFATTDGRAIDPRDDRTVWRDLLVRAGVGHVKLHSARHTAATMMLALGIPIEVVSETLGHTDLKITRGYQHRVDQLHIDAAEKMASAYWD